MGKRYPQHTGCLYAIQDLDGRLLARAPDGSEAFRSLETIEGWTVCTYTTDAKAAEHANRYRCPYGSRASIPKLPPDPNATPCRTVAFGAINNPRRYFGNGTYDGEPDG